MSRLLPPMLGMVLAALTLAITSAAQPPGTPQTEAKTIPLGGPAADMALARVPTDAFLVVSVKVSKLWDSPAAKPLREWAAKQKEGTLESTFGLSPAAIDRVTVFLPGSEDVVFRPLLCLLLTTRESYGEDRLLKALGAGKDADGQPGGRWRSLPEGELFSRVAALDDRTLVLFGGPGHDRAWGNFLVQLLARKPDGPLAAAIAAGSAHDVTIGLNVPTISKLLEMVPEATAYQPLFKATSATLTADFAENATGKLVLTFPDAEAAKAAGPVLEESIKVAAEELSRMVGKPKQTGNSPTNPSTLLAPLGLSALKAARVNVEGATVTATAELRYRDEFARLAAILPKSVADARNTARASNNLKQLLLAQLNYESAYNQFAGDTTNGPNSTIDMSWRVQILPFIEESNLYNQLALGRAWDDPQNLKVLEKAEMPKVFEIPGREAPKGHTYFRIFKMPKDAKGDALPFLKEGEPGPRIVSITDGTSNTFMIVEAREAVPWYKPDLLAYDGKLPLPPLGAKDADKFLAGFCDGHVEVMRPSQLKEETLRAFITIQGGEVIEREK